MKVGANTLIWTAAFDRTHLPLLPRIKERGFDGVEIARFDFHDFPAAEIRRNLKENGLECTFCSALTGDLSLISNDAAVRKKTMAFLRDGIRTAAELDARIFMGPFYSQVGFLTGRRRTDNEWRLAVDGLQSLGEILTENGVVLAIEPLNRFETYFLNTAADAAALCDQVNHPNVSLALDTFHGNIEEKDLGSAFRTAGKHLKHVHACENDRGIPGSGHVDWTGVFGALRDLQYDGWLVIESFGFTIKEIAAAACIWRDLAPSPEDIAFEGLRFLKSRAA
jgi:D-psicose/D-tagatose/L-ribulose 3-epimerase